MHRNPDEFIKTRGFLNHKNQYQTREIMTGPYKSWPTSKNIMINT
jgi:hypothetical protein